MVTRWSHGNHILFRAVWKDEVWAALANDGRAGHC